jgi:hypothetical protein
VGEVLAHATIDDTTDVIKESIGRAVFAPIIMRVDRPTVLTTLFPVRNILDGG